MSGGTAPFRCGTVALAGRTNVGKSTILNRLVAQKLAIIADKPQTTRHTILGVRSLEGAQIGFLDTPGIHTPRHRMNRLMVDAAFEAAASADVVAVVIEAPDGIGPGDLFLFRRVGARRGGQKALLILNKIDQMPREDLLPLIASASAQGRFDAIVPFSARTGENEDRLLAALADLLPAAPPAWPEDTLTDQPARRLVAEFVREKILDATRQELPHETGVIIDRWRERDDGLIEIEASILCERDSQKGILIGAGGRALKRIGTQARADAEALVGARIMLRLHVKVAAGWREDPRLLREMGIGEEP